MSNEDLVLKALNDAGKALKSSEIASAAGIDTKEVSKAIKDLKSNGKVCSPKRCYYAPAE